MSKYIVLLLVCMLLSSCAGGTQGNSEQLANENSSGSSTSPVVQNESDLSDMAESQEGDFILQITSEKLVYKPGEEVKMTGKLKYVGDQEKIMIYHSMTPLAFGVYESSRNIDIGYSMEQPLITTELTKGEWYTQAYKKSGGYSEDGTETEETTFIKSFLLEDGFPEGEYRIRLYGDFYTEENGKKTNYNFSSEINIGVHS
ncbi:MAG: hypothetical protein ACE3L7_29440 [Candidatus Pristimantibacillus sp.]